MQNKEKLSQNLINYLDIEEIYREVGGNTIKERNFIKFEGCKCSKIYQLNSGNR